MFIWNGLFGLILLGTLRYGDYITNECPQGSYSCPKICDVDHIHLPKKECKNGKNKQESRPDSTIIQPSGQYDPKTVAENKPKRL